MLTNNHVVAGADRLNVRLTDGREFDGQVVGTDPSTDVAVVRILAPADERFTPAELGSADDVQVGDWVLALGSPLGLDFSVTAGIVSAKGRAIGILADQDEAPLEAFLQTDAAINPGNSGGPLIDLQGRVVGINAAIESPTGVFAGYGFAVPLEVARKVAQDLVAYGAVHRPRLGVQVADATAADARVFKLPRVEGAVVRSIQPGTPAAQAGLQLGDVVTGADGRTIGHASELTTALAAHAPGDRIHLDVLRYGTPLGFDVRLGQFTRRTAERPRAAAAADGQLLGFQAEELTPELAAQLELRSASGLVITGVDPTSPAAAAGVRPGQVLERVNGEPLASTAELERVRRRLKRGDVVSLVVRDSGGAETIVNFVLRS